jgi:hypothetical protein
MSSSAGPPGQEKRSPVNSMAGSWAVDVMRAAYKD